MKITILFVVLIVLCTFVNAQYQFKVSEKGEGYYLNPVFAGACSPLITMPSNHSYIAQVELFIEGNATTGGLVLFYNDRAYSGILADTENILANLRG